MQVKAQFLKIIQWVGIAVLISGCIVWINQVGIEHIRSHMDQFGIWAPLVLVGLRILSVVIPVLPGTVYSVLAGGLFGFLPGLVIVAIADLLSCTFNFYISRRYGRGLAEKFVGKRWINQVDRISQRHLEKNFFLMTGFLMTGLFDFVAYAIGLTQTSWRQFMTALVCSILIAKPPTVALGAGVFEGGKQVWGMALLGMFGLALLTGWVQRKSLDSQN
ncbi:MAG: TVP38/TMEM64 family protein [Leptolyngbyaceae cyanobacterium CRU_2_3]|nr:TVP38/TMEM64 family protein [Leptolyngbyaceae cyanobacterium CRU_2_3]